MPRTSYHKLYSGTFLSGTVKCRGRYTVNRLYALEDPLKKYTFSNTQPENIFGNCSHYVFRVDCNAWFEIGGRILD